MSEAPAIAALLLAAGNASRYGSLKQLAPIDGVAMVRRTAQAVLAAGLPTWVVLGAEAEAVHAPLAGLPLHRVDNDDWASGMGGSIACGVRAVRQALPGLEALVIVLADQVCIDADDLRQLCAAHRAHPQRIMAADHGDAAGPPCLFPAADFDALAALSGPSGARQLLRRDAARVQRLPLAHARIDIDTPDELRRLLDHTLR